MQGLTDVTGLRNGTISSIKEIIKNLNDADLDPNTGQYILRAGCELC
jgi:hypothetical protein